LSTATTDQRRGPTRRVAHLGRRVAGALAATGLMMGLLALAAPTPAGASSSWTGFVANASDGTLSVLSATGPTQVGSPVQSGSGIGADPNAVAVDGNQVFVANYGDNTVAVFNAGSDQLVETVPVGTNPVGLAVSPDGTEVLVANAFDSTVSVINTSTDTVTGTPVSVPGGLTAITAGTAGGVATAYVTTATTVVPITISTLAVGAAVTLPNTTVGSTSVTPQARAVALTPDGTTLYVADFASGEIDAYATASLSTAPTQIPTGSDAGSEPVAIATSNLSGTTYAYVANFGQGNVSVLEEGSSTPVASVTLKGGPTSGPDGIAVTPDGSSVAVVEQGTGSAELISTNATPSLDAVTGSTKVGSGSGSGPAAVAFPPAAGVAPTLGVTTTSFPAATTGVGYSSALSATGGVGPITWSVTTGASSLAGIGLTLSASGVVSGTPTTGTATFTVTATDAESSTALSGTLTITASALTITTPTTLPSGADGSAYPGVTFGAVGGTAPYTWAGTAPFGLSLSSTGVLSGTPTSAGTTGFNVTVTDSTTPTALTTNESFTITVGPTITLTPSSVPTVVVGQTYAAGSPVTTVSASGGTGPFGYTLSAGTLPPGLSLNSSSGAIVGTVGGAGVFPFTVRATDAGGNTASQAYSLTAFGVTTNAIPTAVVGQTYTAGSPLVTLAAVGGTAPYSWTASPTTLPAGLSLSSSTGAITGTPTNSATTAPFTFTVTDSSGSPLQASTSLTITIGTTPITTTAVTIDLSAHYVPATPAVQLSASGGNGTYTWSIQQGTLPSGLSLNASTGAVTGTPTALGSTPVVFQAQDTAVPTPNVSAEQVTFTVQGGPSVSTTSLPVGQVGVPYSTSLSATGGTGPYTWSIAGGSLPAGLTLSPAGTISGTPTSAGTPAASYLVTDSILGTGTSQSLSIGIAGSQTPPPPPVQHGYWLVGSDGGIFNFGSSGFYGSTGSLRLQRPVVGITPTSDRGGYWLAASDGGVFAFNAGFFGSIPGLGLHPAGSGLPNSLNAPIGGMVPSSDGGGYFMVASDGGVFAFGDAKFAGSCPGIGGCNGTAVAVLPDATGNGYWVVTKNGLVYTFGDAGYFGAPGPQSSPITSAVADPNGQGYLILDADGQVFAYGSAAGLGGLGGLPAGSAGGFDPATAIFDTSDGGGFWVATALGKVYNFGDAPNDGDMSGTRLNGPIIAANGS